MKSTYSYFKPLAIAAVISLSLTGCDLQHTEDSSPRPQEPERSVVVYDTSVPRECSDDGHSLELSEQKLKTAKVNVHDSNCAQLEHIVFAQTCETAPGIFYLHEIPANAVFEAEKNGFRPVADIGRDNYFRSFKGQDGKVDFSVTECL